MELLPLSPEIAPAGSLIIRPPGSPLTLPPGSPLTLPPLSSNSTSSPGFSPNFFDFGLELSDEPAPTPMESGESAPTPTEMDIEMNKFLESLFPLVPEAPVPEAAGPSDIGLQFYKDFCNSYPRPNHYVIDSHGSIPFKTDKLGRYEPVVLKESLSGDEYTIYVVTHTKIGQSYCDINPNKGQGKKNVCKSPSNFADGDQHLKGQLFRNICPEMLFTKLDEDTGGVFDDRGSGVWRCNPKEKIINFDTYAKLTGTRETAVSNLQSSTNDGFMDTMVVYSLSNIIKTIRNLYLSNKFVLHILACLTPGDISGYGLSKKDSTLAIKRLQQIHPSLFTTQAGLPSNYPPKPPPHGHASFTPSIAPSPKTPTTLTVYPPAGTAGKKRRKKRKTNKLYKKKHLEKKNKSNKTNKKSVRRSKRKLRKRNKKKFSKKL